MKLIFFFKYCLLAILSKNLKKKFRKIGFISVQSVWQFRWILSFSKLKLKINIKIVIIPNIFFLYAKTFFSNINCRIFCDETNGPQRNCFIFFKYRSLSGSIYTDNFYSPGNVIDFIIVAFLTILQTNYLSMNLLDSNLN